VLYSFVFSVPTSNLLFRAEPTGNVSLGCAKPERGTKRLEGQVLGEGEDLIWKKYKNRVRQKCYNQRLTAPQKKKSLSHKILL
jgi:hypothetical protein